ncbi:MAG TPA: mechanosensitive ion channel family protein [Armatimonadota bacterium]|nr:mechanosensitive ion channel family protein [Armatimonadota bacterium]
MLAMTWRLSSSARDLVTAGGILLGFVLAMLAVRLLWLRVLGPLVRRTETELDDVILVPLRGLVVWGLLLLGLYAAAWSLDTLPWTPRVVAVAAKVFGIAWLVLAIWTALRIFNGLVAWRVRAAAARAGAARDITHQAVLVRKTVNILVLALGLLYVLRIADVDISPLLATGAIGGLAVALALQDTLSNLFAGLYLTVDKPISVGDFIRLESGDEGFVEEIGWRNAKIRLWANNVVVIPNSKLSQSVITNYFLPVQEMSVYVSCGVSYDSDLQHVEDVTIALAKQVMQAVEGSATDWEPVVRWKEFGDSAITFVVVLRVRDFGIQYKLRSDFIKALHRRFREEGIEIPYPIRTLIMKPSPSDAGAE